MRCGPVSVLTQLVHAYHTPGISSCSRSRRPDVVGPPRLFYRLGICVHSVTRNQTNDCRKECQVPHFRSPPQWLTFRRDDALNLAGHSALTAIQAYLSALSTFHRIHKLAQNESFTGNCLKVLCLLHPSRSTVFLSAYRPPRLFRPSSGKAASAFAGGYPLFLGQELDAKSTLITTIHINSYRVITLFRPIFDPIFL